jgi:hypothetical protein
MATGAGVDENEVLRLVAAAEEDREHPLAQAIVSAAKERGLEVRRTGKFAAVPMGCWQQPIVTASPLATLVCWSAKASHATAFSRARTSRRPVRPQRRAQSLGGRLAGASALAMTAAASPSIATCTLVHRPARRGRTRHRRGHRAGPAHRQYRHGRRALTAGPRGRNGRRRRKGCAPLAHAVWAYVALPEPRDDRGRCRGVVRTVGVRHPHSAHTGRVALPRRGTRWPRSASRLVLPGMRAAALGAGGPGDRASSEIAAHMELASCSARTTENARELD